MKQKNVFVCSLLIGCMLLTACGSSTAGTTTDETTASTAITDTQTATGNQFQSLTQENTGMPGEFNEDMIMGTIQSVDETSITISTMGRGMGGQGMPNGEVPNSERPEMPNGEAPSGGAPAMPNMEVPNGEMPQMNGQGMPSSETQTVPITASTRITDAEGNTITLADLTEATMVTVQLDDDRNAASITISNMNFEMGQPGGNGMGGPGGNGQSAPSSYDALNQYTEDTTISNENISSTGTDENAILVSDGATVSLKQMDIDRTSSDSTGGDSSSFYGIGAAILATNGIVEVTNSTITTDAAGGAGVFAYGEGTAYVSDTTITTTQNTSGGIHVAGGGTLHASNLTVETNGESAAAVRSDRGGGTMTVDGGSYTSNGSGSPAVYCTADITINDSILTATGSEAVCIEGLNSLTLTNCDLTGDMPDLEQNDCTWTVILYQSMSGDSEIGNSTFTMDGGTLTSKNGGVFYTTNTESTFYLSDVNITTTDDCEFFLKCTGNQNQRGWGQSGANGANCIFTANAQEMIGNILWDSISTLDFVMENDSTLTGAFLQDESAAGNGGNGYANLTIDESSTWIVTGDSALSSLVCNGTITDTEQNTVTIKGTDGTIYVEGTSSYTITVSSFSSDF